MIKKLSILFRAVIGEIIKKYFRLFWQSTLKNYKSAPTVPIIVSLTSYGDRIKNVVPYAIISILAQTLRPSKVLLWLDGRKWNMANIPIMLQKLRPYGLEIKFCKDVKSFTKLVPSLRMYANDTIVTIDDDLFYSSTFIEEIYSAHLKNPNKIIVENFCYPELSSNGVKSYRDWKEYHFVNDSSKFSPMLIFPQGFGGVLYPANSLYKDVINETLFMKLAPHADDIWFYIMGIINKTEKCCIIDSQTKYYFLDLFRQIKTKDRLHDVNVGECQNDVQLENLLEYYKINLSDYERN